MPDEIRQLINDRLQKRVARLVGSVTTVGLGTDGRNTGWLTVLMADGQTVKARVGPGETYYKGDQVEIENWGTAAAAYYKVGGLYAGNRPASGMIEIPEDVNLGPNSFQPGDLIIGDPYGAHLWYDFSAGLLKLRSATQTNGQLAAAGYLDLGDPAGLHLHLDADSIDFVNEDGDVVSSWDSTTRTIYGIERFGRPLGPCMELREIVDPDGTKRYGMRILGTDGVPGFAVLSGTEADPDDWSLMLGSEGDDNRLTWMNGELTLTFGGGKMTLDKDGITLDADRDTLNTIVWETTQDANYQVCYVGGYYIRGSDPPARSMAIGVLNGADDDLCSLDLFCGDDQNDTGIGIDCWPNEGIMPAFTNITLRMNNAEIAKWNSDGKLIQQTNAIINESGNDADTRIEGNTDANLLYVDAGEDRVGIGTNAPATKLDVAGYISGHIKHITWIGGADFVDPHHTGKVVFENATGAAELEDTVDGTIDFPFPIPYQMAGHTVVITKITIYYYTADNAAYITDVKLIASDLDGTITAAIDHGDDLGNGSSGNANHDVYSGTYSMTDYPHFLEVMTGGVDALDDVKVYGFRVEWEASA